MSLWRLTWLGDPLKSPLSCSESYDHQCQLWLQQNSQAPLKWEPVSCFSLPLAVSHLLTPWVHLLGICEQNSLCHHKPPLKMCWSSDVKCSMQGSSWAYKGAGLHQVVSSLQMRLHSVESRFSRLTSLTLLPISKFHSYWPWALEASSLAAGGCPSSPGGCIQSEYMLLSLGYIWTLSLGTINEVAAEFVCELSVHVHLKGAHLSAHGVISPEKTWHLGFSRFIQ